MSNKRQRSPESVEDLIGDDQCDQENIPVQKRGAVAKLEPAFNKAADKEASIRELKDQVARLTESLKTKDRSIKTVQEQRDKLFADNRSLREQISSTLNRLGNNQKDSFREVLDRLGELKQQLVALPPQQLVPQPLVVPQQQQPTVYGLGPAPPLPVYIGPGAPAPYPATYQQQGIVYHRSLV